MLFLSERSWKHHYVTVLLPYSYLVGEFFSNRLGPRSRARLVGSWAVTFSLMAAASADLGQFFAEGQGHEIAQGYGSFLWAGVILYGMVAWRVWSRRNRAQPVRLAGIAFLADSAVSSRVHGRLSADCRFLNRKSSQFPDVRRPIVTIVG